MRAHPLLRALLITMLSAGAASAQSPGDTAPPIRLKTLAGGSACVLAAAGLVVLPRRSFAQG